MLGPGDRAREERRDVVRPFSAAEGVSAIVGPRLGALLPARDAGREEVSGCTDGARDARREDGREALRGEVIGSRDGARPNLRGELIGPREGARDVARPVVRIGGRSAS